jgi:hypothetical protein
MITSNVLHLGGHFSLDHDYGKLGESGCGEWHESLDLQLLRFNNINITEHVDKGETIENFLFMGEMPKKAYKQYRKEYDKEGYSEIAECYINYNWVEIASKKYKVRWKQ